MYYYVYTWDHIDQSPVLTVDIRDCSTGYATVAAIPITALTPLPSPITYAGIPSHSKVAVIKVPKLRQVIGIPSMTLHTQLTRYKRQLS